MCLGRSASGSSLLAEVDVRAEARKVMDALFASLSVQFKLKEK